MFSGQFGVVSSLGWHAEVTEVETETGNGDSDHGSDFLVPFGLAPFTRDADVRL